MRFYIFHLPYELASNRTFNWLMESLLKLGFTEIRKEAPTYQWYSQNNNNYNGNDDSHWTVKCASEIDDQANSDFNIR